MPAAVVKPSKVTGRLAEAGFLASIIKQDLEIVTTGSSVLHSVEFDANTNVLFVMLGLGRHERYADPGAAPKFEIRVRNVDCITEVLDEIEPHAIQAMETVLGRSIEEIRESYSWIKNEKAVEIFRNTAGDTLHIMVNTIVWKGLKEAGL